MKKQELFNNVTEGSPYQRQPKQMGLYNAAYEHDACGVGMLVNIHGEKSHDIVESALKVLENMRHRGAEGADNKTGDGAGIMLQIPHEFILLQGIPVPEKGRYGTGLLFLPKNGKDQAAILSIIIEEIEKEGLTLMHLRNVPTCPEILGESALANEPNIKQVFITGFTETETADRKLYLIRKRIENKVRLSSIPTKAILPADWHWCTLVSVPIHSLHGDWHNHSACWHTTVKSTRSVVTADGWKPAKAYSPLLPWVT